MTALKSLLAKLFVGFAGSSIGQTILIFLLNKIVDAFKVSAEHAKAEDKLQKGLDENREKLAQLTVNKSARERINDFANGKD